MIGSGAGAAGRFLRAGASDSGLPAAPSVDTRVAFLRAASVATPIGAAWLWQARTTGSVSLSAFALLAAVVLVSAVVGAAFASVTRRLVASPGMAYELLVGFLICNTLLFLLTLVSPFGFGVHMAVLAAIAAIIGATRATRARGAGRSLQCESGSLACIAFSTVAATLWVGDQQPMTTAVDDLTVFKVWLDVFIHAREISAFAQSHGLQSISDIKLAGVPASAYHFSSYMVPAALNALTGTSALDSYAAFQLPFGILLVGLAAYALAAVTLKAIWPAVFAAMAVLALPDAYQQGFGIRFLSYHFMSQVNLGMLYGIACITVSWLFMIEACRRDRVGGLAVAYALLATCLSYKAHLFVANALILMLYPCMFFGRGMARIRPWWRVTAGLLLVLVFGAFVSLAQSSPRMPTLRLDGSGIGAYVEILMGGFADGHLRHAFDWLYHKHRLPRVASGVLAASLVLFGSFGIWVFATPVLYWRTRRTIEPRAWGFVLLIVFNYMVMSLGLALDQQGVGMPEEFVNRPHAWAYFVVVVVASGAAVAAVASRNALTARWKRGLAALVVVLLLLHVSVAAHRLQTFPEWAANDDYIESNAAPTCLVRAALYIRDHGQPGEVLQDSQFDPVLRTTAIAERQGFATNASFGGHRALVAERIADIKAVQATADPKALFEWTSFNHVTWYVMHPADSDRWDQHFLDQAVYRCERFSVFRFNG